MPRPYGVCGARYHAARLFVLFLIVGTLIGLYVLDGSRLRTTPLTPPAAHAADKRQTTTQARAARAADAYGNLPLAFEANRGQTDARVKFLSRGSGYTLFLTPDEAVLSLRKPAARVSSREAAAVLRMRLKGSHTRPRVEGVNELPGASNYFVGGDPARWRTGVPRYERVRYEGVYPGVDLVYYGNQRQLEYDFHVAPGVDPSVIRLGFEGVERLEVDAGGDLLLRTAGGDEVRQRKPFVYQEADGARREVAGCGYVLAGAGEVGFRLGEYDRARPLVIDPVLIYSTYLGGGSGDVGKDIAVDAAGNAYVAGATTSADFPAANAFQSSSRGYSEVFVTKLNADGTALVYSTYLGGSNSESANGIAVDNSGHAYLTGSTSSDDFPLANPLQSVRRSDDIFMTKLSPSGDALVYSTLLGGNYSDVGSAVAVDSVGNAYLTGVTYSPDFPTVNAIQTTSGDDNDGGFTSRGDAFVTKINPAGSALVFSTYLGGVVDDQGVGIAVDPAGRAYVSGTTNSEDFPVVNALQPQRRGYQDAFVAKFEPAGTSLVYSTYLGGAFYIDQFGGQFGSGIDAAGGIAADADGNAYVTGWTQTSDFPTTPGAFQQTKPPIGFAAAVRDVFVTKINPSGASLVFSTFLGGMRDDVGFDIALDSARNIYVSGRTDSTNFPTLDAFQPKKAGPADDYGYENQNISDAFVTKLNSTGTSLVHSTFLGGNRDDWSNGIAVDSSGNAYATGQTENVVCDSGYTWCGDFPLVNPVRPNPSGTTDAFVVKLAAELGQRITGRVLDNMGNPRPDAIIQVTGTVTRTITLDSDGNFTTGSLKAGGTYTLTPVHAGLAFEPLSQTISDLRGDVSNVNFTGVQQYHNIRGRVTNQEGAPLAGVKLDLYGFRRRTTYTDADGNYAFDNLPAGASKPGINSDSIDYSIQAVDGVHAFQPGLAEFAGLHEDRTADFVGAPIEPTYFDISGKVTNLAGLPMGGITVTMGGTRAETTVTDAEGFYSFRQLPTANAEYQVTANSPGLFFDPPTNTISGSTQNVTANFRFPGTPRANLPPNVFVISPQANSTYVPGSDIQFTADAEDPDGAVAKVEFFIGATKVGEDTTGLYTYDWKNVAPGSYSLTVVATDNLGAVGTSLPINVTVSDSYKPTVSISWPPDQSTFSYAPSSFVVQARVQKPDGSSNQISKVDFYGDSKLIETKETYSLDGATYVFTIVWDNVQAGTHVLTARATDTGGATSVSAPVTVTVRARPSAASINGRLTTSEGGPLAGVAVALSGSQSATATTDASGNYSFTNLPAGGDYTVTPSQASGPFTPASRTFNKLGGQHQADFVAAASRPPSLSGLTLNASSVTGPCQTTKGKVTLSGPAPAGGVRINITNGNPAAAMPAEVTVPAGLTSASFTISASQVNANTVGDVTASARDPANGTTSFSKTLTVLPIGVKTLTLSPNPADEQSASTGTLTLVCAVPAGGTSVVVSLTSDAAAVAQPAVPSLSFGPGGGDTQTFSVQTKSVSATSYANITAKPNNGGTKKNVKLTVNNNVP